MVVKVRRGKPLSPAHIGYLAQSSVTDSPAATGEGGKTVSIHIIRDVWGEGVTFWKNILSLFGDGKANRFEGAGLCKRLGNGWQRVCGVNRK